MALPTGTPTARTLYGIPQPRPAPPRHGENGTSSVAYFGYLSVSGSGSTPGGSGLNGNTPLPKAITLDPSNPITAGQVVFGENPNSTALAKLSQYMLSGGTLNLGDGVDPGNITLDCSSSNASSPFRAQITSNLNVAGGQPLSFFVNGPNQTSYLNTFLYLGGTNSFSSAIVGGSPWNTTSVNALVFSNTQSVNANGQVPNITLGNNAAVNDYAANGTTMTLGTITLDPTVGTGNGPFQRNVTNYGDYGTSQRPHRGRQRQRFHQRVAQSHRGRDSRQRRHGLHLGLRKRRPRRRHREWTKHLHRRHLH